MARKKASEYIIPERRSREGLPSGALKGQGSPASECSVCGNVFSTPHNFDEHRLKINGPGQEHKQVCVDPESVGLVLGTSNTWISGSKWFGEEEE